jgi:hypothetical protein
MSLVLEAFMQLVFLVQSCFQGAVWFAKCNVNGNGNDSQLNTGGNKFE